MSSHADTIRDALTTYVPPGFRDEEGVWHDGPIQDGALAALDALLAENERLREVVDALLPASGCSTVEEALEALAGDAE